jgi:sirohydrochlorin cobaltochelatase
MSEIVSARADEVIPAVDRERTTVVILGHGTTAHPRSAETTLALVENLRSEARYARVLPAFLDQDPTLNRILATERTGPMAVIPFFVSEGWHVGTTIPRDVALQGGEDGPGSPPVWCSRPVGTHPAMAEVVLDLVGYDPDTAVDEEASPSHEAFPLREDGLPAAEARTAFLSWIRAAAPDSRVFLQTVVQCSGEDRFEIRHEKDRDVAPTALRSLNDLDQLRDVVTRTATGEYRPLSTAPNLQKGWRFADLAADEAWEAYAQLYPAAPVHWNLKSIGRLDVVSFREAADRQTGLYARTADLGDARVEALSKACCSPERCLREPTWALQMSGRSAESRASHGQGLVVPCPAPCSVFFSIATHAVNDVPPPASTLDPPQGSR